MKTIWELEFFLKKYQLTFEASILRGRWYASLYKVGLICEGEGSTLLDAIDKMMTEFNKAPVQPTLPIIASSFNPAVPNPTKGSIYIGANGAKYEYNGTYWKRI